MKMMSVTASKNIPEDIRSYELESMILSFISGNRYNSNFNGIEFYFIARMKTKEEFFFRFVFINDYAEDHSFLKLFDSLMRTSLFSNSERFNEFILYYANFIENRIEDKDSFIVDFDMIAGENSKQYFICMNSKDSSKFIKVLCPNYIQTGINILYRGISLLNVNDSIFIEAQKWLIGEELRKTAKYETLNNFEIIDISRSTRIRKNYYSGVAVMKFTAIDAFDNSVETTVAMNYTRDHRVSRSVSSTVDFLSGVYGSNVFSIINICGANITNDINKAEIQFISFKDNMYKVFRIPYELHKEILSWINKI